METNRARRALIAHREAALTQLGASSEQIRDVIAAADGSNLDDEHDPEGATIAFERAQLSALRDQARERIADIDDALQRLETGNYGRCEQCGSPIPDERLAGRPASRHCVRCARRRR